MTALVILMGRCRWSTWTQESTGLVLTSDTTAIGRANAVREPEVGAISASGSQMYSRIVPAGPVPSVSAIRLPARS